MRIGIISEDRLCQIPERYWASHEFCFHIHDLIVQITKLAEEYGAGEIAIFLQDESEFQRLLLAEDPIDFLANTGRTTEERRLMINHIFRALFPDMLHFIHGALTALEMRKFTMALALFRKPFKEGLPLLASMCADEVEFFQRFKVDPRHNFDNQTFNAEAKKRAIAAAIDKCDGMDFADTDTLCSILFDYGNSGGFAGLFDKATHLFTRRQGNATEDYNINFIFKDPRDNDIYESCYQQIAYVLLFIHLMQLELVGRMNFPKESYLKHLSFISIGAYECIFCTGRSRMTQLCNRQFRPFMDCAVCGQKIRLRKSTGAKFFLSEMLECNHCKYVQHFPVRWLFSQTGDDL